jgi:hypothetical protein
MNNFLIPILFPVMAFIYSPKYAIQSAAETVGVSYSTMYKIAKIESNLNPKARNKKTSARGLFQIIKSTEKELRHKYDISGSIFNPYVNSLMGAYILKESLLYLRRYNIKETDVNAYLVHFFGKKGFGLFNLIDNKSKVCSTMRLACKYNSFMRGKTAGEVREIFRTKLRKI